MTLLTRSLPTISLFLGCFSMGRAAAAQEHAVEFLKDVRPILERRCFECHGDKKQKAGLRLDTRAGLFEGSDPEYLAVVPKNVEASLIYQRIALPANDPDIMPPKGEPLTAEEVSTIHQWIETGADWKEASPVAEVPEEVQVPSQESQDVEPPPPTTTEAEPVEDASGQTIDFRRDIRPILSANCFQCHGPDAKHRKAKLRLDTKEGAFATLRSGNPVIAPGDSENSELLLRVFADDLTDQMPPPDSGRSLTDTQKALLREWIAQGASWEEHWSFVPPATPEIPALDDEGWVQNPIDSFVLTHLQEKNLNPSEEADPRNLLRRVTLDLTGLPPTPEEIQAFANSDSPNDYENVVDRLLESPRFGEHMARYWLDIARYGDTHGLHLDNYREMWPYRDWVVEAFNSNLPYDQFVIEQLAGDLLPEASLAQQIASGFNRAHVSTNEGGSIVEEVYVRNVVDRVNTAGTAFLGLTVGCAQCHDHKFDPIRQKDYYQLFAIFNNLDGKAMDGNAKAHAPVVKVPSAEQTQKLLDLRSELTTLEESIAAELSKVQYQEPELQLQAAEAVRKLTILVDDAFPPGAKIEGDGLLWVEAPKQLVHSGRLAMQRRSKGNQQHYFRNADQKLRIGAGDTLFAWVYLDPDDPPKEIMLQFNNNGSDGWKHRAYWGQNLIPYGKSGTTERQHLGDLPKAGEWIKLEVPVSKVGLAPGMVVHGVAFTQFDGTAYWDSIGIDSATPQQSEDFAWIDDDVPSGAQLQGDGKTWNWVGGGEHPVKSGLRSLRRSGGDRLNQDFFTGAQPLILHSGDRLFAHVWMDPEDPPRSIQLQFNNGNWNHRVRWGEPAHGAGGKDGADYHAGPVPALGEWIRLEVGLSEVGLKPGDKLNGWAFTQVAGTVYWDEAGVHTWSPPNDAYLESQSVWEQLAVSDDGVPENIRKDIEVPVESRKEKQKKNIRDYYLRYIYSGTRQIFDDLEKEVVALNTKIKETDDSIPTTLVMKERVEPREAFVLERGQYDARGEKVERDTPAALPVWDPSLPRNRLGFAQWLVDPQHPLTARVAVNRFWQQLFGQGLVKTSEDFGNQGSPPTHPHLLDWLTTQFMEEDWDVKNLMKRMVMSSTYKQSSRVTPELLRIDPENQLYSRGPRFRLDAETLRDQALALSGLLVHKLGGPGVKPPQPDGLWKAVAYVGSNTMNFKKDEGADKVYRRSLYTFWKRTAPPPQMNTFDAPSREECRVRRERTNTPLQALLMMNDPQYVEAARHLAQRILQETKGSPAEMAQTAFEWCTGRLPGHQDLADILGLYQAQLAEFQMDLEAASRLIMVGETPPDNSINVAELAAWTMVANLLLNLDEVVTKG